jgi:hypothetical protein
MNVYTYETSPGLINSHFKDDIESVLKEARAFTKIKIEPAPKELRMKLAEYDGSLDLSYVIAMHFDLDTIDKRVFIATEGDTSFKRWCIHQCGHAYWGCSTEIVAVDYSPKERKRGVQLHEFLHLLGVDDCYEEKSQLPKLTCTSSNCIMRYQPNVIEVCSHVVRQLQNFR